MLYALLYETTCCIMVKCEIMCNAILTGASVQIKVSKRNAVSLQFFWTSFSAAQFQHSSRDLTGPHPKLQHVPTLFRNCYPVSLLYIIQKSYYQCLFDIALYPAGAVRPLEFDTMFSNFN